MGRTVIVTGTGNNGSQPWHAGGILQQGKTEEIQLAVGAFEPTLNVQLWKDYEDEMEIYLESPSGERIGPLYERLGPQRHLLENTELLIYYGKPGPYQLSQEIYIDFIPEGNYVDSGVWKVLLSGKRVRSGQYFLWLPGGNVLNRGTGFYSPRAVGTLTIPSTAGKVISVGAYDSRQNAYADFSGRGSQFLPIRKPDLAAPGVSITAPVPGGGYATVTGTSFAAPFVSGSAALLMEWGIVKGNDPFLYGEKVKAYLRKGAQSVGGYEEYSLRKDEDGNIITTKMMQNHGNSQELFEYSDESDGTQRLFDLIPLFYEHQNNRVIFIDEIDRSLHTNLTRRFLELFYTLTEDADCQIIATTHDSNLLDLDLVRQDEIWFVKRSEDHSSKMYSLNRYKERYDKKIDKEYLLGRYDAIPIFDEEILEDMND